MYTLAAMFTGIIEAQAEIVERTDSKLVIKRPSFFDDLKTGSSVAVCGVCLSVIGLTEKAMTFDVMPVSWQKSKLGTLKPGDLVNVERAMPASGRFDGHIVQGHCEGVGTVVSIVDDQVESSRNYMIAICLPKALVPFVVEHGSIAIDGVSLTVAGLEDKIATVALVPLTLFSTTLGTLKKGDKVNVETDILVKYLVKPGGISHLTI